MHTVSNIGDRNASPLAILFALVLSLVFVPAAIAATPITQPGSGPGQASQPEGLATDRTVGETESGRLYVADRGNNRALAFDDEGGFLFSFGAGLLGAPNSVAVDDFAGSAALHDVYVVDFTGRRIVRFSAAGVFKNAIGAGEYSATEPEKVESMQVAVGPGGEVYVVDVRRTSSGSMLTTRLRRYEAGGGTPLFEKDIVSVPAGAIAGGNLRGIAVDSGGNLYISKGQPDPGLCKYDDEGEEIFCLSAAETLEPRALATDKADHLFALDVDRGVAADFFFPYRVVAEYDPEGNSLRRLGYGELASGPRGLAVHPDPGGPVYVSDGSNISGTNNPVVLALGYPPPGPLIVPEPCEAPSSTLRSVSAALQGEVNPQGDPTAYHFEYLSKAAYDAAGGSFAGATRLPANAADDPETDSDPRRHLASLNAAELTPETEYVCRLVAANAESLPGEPAVGPVGGFKTSPPLEVLAAWASEPGIEVMKLHGEVNPRDTLTTGYFEYVTEDTYLEDKAEGGDGFAQATRVPDTEGGEQPLDFGAGDGAVARGVSISGLKPDTSYRYRIVGVNEFATRETEGAFTTFSLPTLDPDCPNRIFRVSTSARLPDCRAYELVSPLTKNADVIPPPEGTTGLPAALEQSSILGDKLAYTSTVAFVDSVSSPYASQYIAQRIGDSDGDGNLEEGEGWQTHSINPPRGRPLVAAAAQRDTELKALSPDLCQAWLRTVSDPPLAEGALAGSLNLYRRADDLCGGPTYVPLTDIDPPDGEILEPELQGHSANGQRAIYVTPDVLPGTGPSRPALEGKRQLYVVGVEGTRFICIKPGGAVSAVGCSAGTFNFQPSQDRRSSLAGAISADGERIYWSDSASGRGSIYVRLNPFAKGGECTVPGSRCTVAVSKGGEEATGGVEVKSQFWAAATNGSRAIFSTANKAGDSDLYEFELEGEGGTTTSIAGEVLGVAGTSANATVVYFASREAIPGSGTNSEGDEAIPGSPNLYRYEGGEYLFVATLAGGDVSQGGNIPGPLAAQPMNHTARVTPDGRRVAFMSYATPTDYDNTDSISGKPAAEVYLFDATTSGAGRLLCASCNPSGARPVAFDRGAEIHGVAPGTWVAAQLPVWLSSLHGPRALSDDGLRLYFNTDDALSPRDTNGVRDVYQWEATGKGGCQTTDASFSKRNGGCIDLISSGTSILDSEFLDADPTGENVFIRTLSSLVTQDPGLIDIYDARVRGGLPSPPVPGPECEGEACSAPPPPPDDLRPASALYLGSGKVTKSSKVGHCPKRKRRVKRKGKVLCVKKRHVSGRQGQRRKAMGHTSSRRGPKWVTPSFQRPQPDISNGASK